jgi:uncharacterized protein DUF4382
MLQAPKNFPYENPPEMPIGKMSKKILAPVVLVLVATLGAFFAVNSQLTSLQSIPAQGLGSVNIHFTSTGLDAASQGQGNGQGQGHTATGTITNVVVRFTKVEIHAANSTGNDGWTTLNVPETIIDFTQTTSVSTIINGASLPAGKYNQIRLFADHVTVSMRSGENLIQRTLNIPSGKIEVPITPGGFDLAQSGTVNVTLTFTFNANELAHNPKNMTPVVKAQVA